MLQRSQLRELAWMQLLFLGNAVAVAGVLWASNIHPELLIVLVYAMMLGNFVTFFILACTPMIDAHRFPYDWFAFMGLLILVTPIAVAIPTAIIYFFIAKSNSSLWNFFVSGWRFPSIVTVIFGVVFNLYRQTKQNLERRNRELEKVVEVESSERVSHDREMQRAREIQQGLLPTTFPQVEGFEVAAAWQPARLVGGDYYDVIPLGPQRLGICIADVVGKSVSAALLMASVQASVRAFATDASSPAQLCDRINKVLCNNIASDKFVTLFYGELDAANGLLEYCNAGHLEPVVVRSDGEAEVLRGGGLVLGVLPTAKYENASVDLSCGDRMVLFTDGISEAETVACEEFGEQRVMDLVRQNLQLTAEQLKSLLLQRVDEFCGSQLRDDATLIVIAALEPVGAAGAGGSRGITARD
jgi:sigma-B regulation protein RsbU (phosphoserine phosphatase)